MIIKNFVRDSSGKCSFESEVTEEEASALIELALTILIQSGSLGVDDEHEDFYDNTGETLQ